MLVPKVRLLRDVFPGNQVGEADPDILIIWLVGVNLDGKKVLVLGAHGALEAALQCLFQRKGSLTMSSWWKTPQLESKVNFPWRCASLDAPVRKAERLGMCEPRVGLRDKKRQHRRPHSMEIDENFKNELENKYK